MNLLAQLHSLFRRSAPIESVVSEAPLPMSDGAAPSARIALKHPGEHFRHRLINDEIHPVSSTALTAKKLAQTPGGLETIKNQLLQLAPELGSARVEQIISTAQTLMAAGIHLEDALTVALQERLPKKAHPLPEALQNRLLPPQLTGQNVFAFALQLNAHGTKMDDAIVLGLQRFSGPRAMTDSLAMRIVETAQQLFSDGARAPDALNIALRKTLPKATSADALA